MRESATRGGSFWTRTRWGKAVAAPGVRGQDAREKLKKTVGARCSGKVRPGEARFGPELDGEKPWRRQCVRGQDAREKWKKTVGARCSGPGLAQEMKETSFFYKASEGAFGSVRGQDWRKK